jgi:hypothetical protein
LQGLSALGHTEKDIGTRGAALVTIAITEIPAFISPSHTLFDSLKKRPLFGKPMAVPSNGAEKDFETDRLGQTMAGYFLYTGQAGDYVGGVLAWIMPPSAWAWDCSLA